MNDVYEIIRAFKQKFRSTVAWRIKQHSKIIQKHLNPGENILFGFAAQGDASSFEIFNTYAVVLTNKRILVAQKRVVFGYTFLAITPDMFNDLTVHSGLIWGKIYIDTVKETVILSNISKRALDDIETPITEYMMNAKQKYIKEKQDS